MYFHGLRWLNVQPTFPVLTGTIAWLVILEFGKHLWNYWHLKIQQLVHEQHGACPIEEGVVTCA